MALSPVLYHNRSGIDEDDNNNSKHRRERKKPQRRKHTVSSDRTSTLVMSVLKAIVVDWCSNKSKSELIDLWTEPNVTVISARSLNYARLNSVCSALVPIGALSVRIACISLILVCLCRFVCVFFFLCAISSIALQHRTVSTGAYVHFMQQIPWHLCLKFFGAIWSVRRSLALSSPRTLSLMNSLVLFVTGRSAYVAQRIHAKWLLHPFAYAHAIATYLSSRRICFIFLWARLHRNFHVT